MTIDSQLKEEFQHLQAKKEDLEERLAEREAELQRQTERYAQLWCFNCDQLGEFDRLIEEKDAKERELTGRVQQLKDPRARPLGTSLDKESEVEGTTCGPIYWGSKGRVELR